MYSSGNLPRLEKFCYLHGMLPCLDQVGVSDDRGRMAGMKECEVVKRKASKLCLADVTVVSFRVEWFSLVLHYRLHFASLNSAFNSCVICCYSYSYYFCYSLNTYIEAYQCRAL